MVPHNTPKRSTRSPGPFTRQQQPSFSLDSVVRKDPKTIGHSDRLTEAWVREQQDAFPATIVKLTEQGFQSESQIKEHHVQRIHRLKQFTKSLSIFRT